MRIPLYFIAILNTLNYNKIYNLIGGIILNRNIKLLSILKYITYFLISINIIYTGNYNAENALLLLSLMLLFIINTQIRNYYLKNNTTLLMLSLSLDIMLISFLYLKFQGFIFIYYFITILDASMILSSKNSYFMMSLIYGSLVMLSLRPMYYSLQNTTAINVFINTIIVVIFGALGRSVAEEQKRKKEAQELYDKLRISESQLKDAYERLEEYSETIEELTLLRERNRISRELHDSVGHTLSTIIIQLQALPHMMHKDAEKTIKMVDKLIDFSKNGMENVRRTIKELKPTDFDKYQGIFSIKELIFNYEKLTHIKINFITFNEAIELNSDESFVLYRIIQEALNNASKHSKASNINLSLQGDDKNIRLYIKDDGIGAHSLSQGFGLSNMEERVKKLGGTIEFNTGTSKGFEIIANIPRI